MIFNLFANFYDDDDDATIDDFTAVTLPDKVRKTCLEGGVSVIVDLPAETKLVGDMIRVEV